MPAIRGVVTIAQESRFQLVDKAGAGHLFILSPHARAQSGDLEKLRRDQARVRVSYTHASDVMGYVAHRLERV